MEQTNMYHYMTTGAFLDDITTDFDCIIREKLPVHLVDPTAVEKLQPYPHRSCEELGYDFRPDGAIMQCISQFSRVLVMLDTISPSQIPQFFSAIAALRESSTTKTHVVICHIGSGVTGVINKHTPDQHDIAVVLPYMRVVEPLDVYHMRVVLAHIHDHVCIRIPYDDIAQQLFEHDATIYYTLPYVSMQHYGYTGGHGTIVVNPALLPSVSQALQYIHTQTDRRYDLFVVHDYSAAASRELLESIDETGRLIIIHDAGSREDLTYWYGEKAFHSSDFRGKRDSWHTTYKLPSYEKLTTFLPSYLYDVVGLSHDDLVSYLQK